jgi:hypothetical protein
VKSKHVEVRSVGLLDPFVGAFTDGPLGGPLV